MPEQGHWDMRDVWGCRPAKTIILPFQIMTVTLEVCNSHTDRRRFYGLPSLKPGLSFLGSCSGLEQSCQPFAVFLLTLLPLIYLRYTPLQHHIELFDAWRHFQILSILQLPWRSMFGNSLCKNYYLELSTWDQGRSEDGELPFQAWQAFQVHLNLILDECHILWR